jgi:hypothetical protein
MEEPNCLFGGWMEERKRKDKDNAEDAEVRRGREEV